VLFPVRGSLPALFFLAPFLGAAQAGGSPAPQPSAQAVNEAIERGVQYLLKAQNRDGSWGMDLYERGLAWHDLRDGATALALYALTKCGLAPDHPSLERGAAFLLLSYPRHTYSTGIQLHALGGLGVPAHKKRMQELVKELADLEVAGGFDYPGLGRADLSNTQVAALGFRAADQAGLTLPKGIWARLVEATLRHQESPVEIPGSGLLPREQRRMAGFAYEPGGAPSASMTTAGLTVLGIASEVEGRVPHALDVRVAEARQLAQNWLVQNFSVEGNPHGEAAWHYYYLYGLERAGAFGGFTHFGAHDWYAEGAAQLLKEQRADGGWRMDGRTSWPPTPMPVANTCFALLFLRKATFSQATARARPGFRAMEEADSEVWVRVDAQQVWTAWISGFAPEVRAELGLGPQPRKAGEPLPTIERVEWRLDGAVVARVVAAGTAAGEGVEVATDERFAARFTPPGGGEHVLEARVFARAKGGAELEFASKPVRVHDEEARAPWMSDYVDDAESNLFRGQVLTLTCSSEESGFHRPAEAFDGLQGSSWYAREGDPEPWLALESARGIKLKELLLSPAAASEILRAECVKFATVEIRINGAKEPLRVTLDPDPMKKTVVALGRTTLVRRLELRVIEPPVEPGKYVGFAEIEGR
jgi:hypothetical protein